MLGQTITCYSTAGGGARIPDTTAYYGTNLDRSKISSVNITILENNPNIEYNYDQNYYNSLTVFGAIFKKVGTYQKDIPSNTDDNDIYLLTGTTTWTGDKQYFDFRFTINSFTTIDGKVHTADNLNY